MARAILVVVAITLMGCADPRPPRPDNRIAVHDFEVGPAVTRISRYTSSTDDLGHAFATTLARSLTGRGFVADVVPVGASDGDADLRVIGRITEIDGGSRGTRALVATTIGWGWTSYGIGGSTCAIEGAVYRRDGDTPLYTFRERFTRHGTGYFWARFGESSERQVGAILKHIGRNVAQMVDTGQYRGGLESGPGATPVAAVQPPAPQVLVPHDSGQQLRSVSDRLHELDKLKADGLISQHEYDQRRAVILQAL